MYICTFTYIRENVDLSSRYGDGTEWSRLSSRPQCSEAEILFGQRSCRMTRYLHGKALFNT